MIERMCSFLVVTSGKPVGQIEAHLMAEHAQRAGAGAIGLSCAAVANASHQVEVLDPSVGPFHC